MSEHLSEREQARIRKYVAACLPLLRLDQWQIDLLLEEPQEDDFYASVRTGNTRRHAELRVCKDWDKLDAGKKRWVLLHECAHLVLRPLLHTLSLIEDDAQTHIGAIGWGIWSATFHVQEELATDEIALCLLPYAPPWPR